MTSRSNNISGIEKVKIDHFAIIMDGNRRWAKNKNLNSKYGHKAGIANAIKLLKSINKDKTIKVKYITLYVFAINNWKRSVREVSILFSFIEEMYHQFEELSYNENFKIRHFGSKNKLPNSIIRIINDLHERTKKNKGIVINLAFNYSGREEILNSIKQLIINKKKINHFEKFLYSDGIPNPDLIIRTGGEFRMSDFLIWQSAYSELYFTKILWPNFKIKNLRNALFSFNKRKRNYGK